MNTQDTENVYLILELLSGGDLQYHLDKEKKFTEDVAKYFIASALQGIGALHDAGWVYRDMKPENILLSADGHCKLTDLGLATKVFPPPRVFTSLLSGSLTLLTHFLLDVT